jgi:hypothetical protein
MLRSVGRIDVYHHIEGDPRLCKLPHVETHERIGYCIEPECTERVELAGKLYCRAHAYTPLSE